MSDAHPSVLTTTERIGQQLPWSQSMPGSPLAPVGERERLTPVDALRGFALLGILVINVVLFGLPFAILLDPAGDAVARYAGELTGANLAVWWIQSLLFEQKMMTIFSMLFGAGLVLMSLRAAPLGGQFGGVYYRRITWLLVIGLLHAYLFWYGDILTLYAICGFLLYPLRNLRPRWLLTIGSSVLIVPMVLTLAFGLFLGMARDSAAAAEARIAAGETPTAFESEMRDVWTVFQEQIEPSPQEVDRHIARMRGSLVDVLKENAMITVAVQIEMTLVYGIWRVGGLMLIGMALMRLEVFSAMRSSGLYLAMMAFGYGLGLPLSGIGAWDFLASEFDHIRNLMVGSHFGYVGSILVAFGHVGALMLICRSGIAAGLIQRLAALGQMALTNYLAQTLICTTFFFGWGFGFFASLERATLMLLVVSIWALQLAWSPWWLARYRYGPAEWLWRSLTYFRLQPMRR